MPWVKQEIKNTGIPDVCRDPATHLAGLWKSAAPGDVLWISSPVLDDNEIINALLKIRSKGVLVKILTSLTNHGRMVTKGWDGDKASLGLHHDAIRQLAGSGCLIHSPDTTPHAKVYLLEGKYAWVGSANLARNSLSEKAIEILIPITESNELFALSKLLGVHWESSPLRMRGIREHSQQDVAIIRSQRVVPSPEELEVLVENGSWILQLQGNHAHLTNRIIHCLSEAQNEIILTALSLFETNKIPPLHKALEEALERGVRIKVVIRPEHFSDTEYPDASTIQLVEKGMVLLGLPGIHAKGFRVDNLWCGIQSANFNPYSLDPQLENANCEMGAVYAYPFGPLASWCDALTQLVNSAPSIWVPPS